MFSNSKTRYNPNEFKYELGWIVSLKPRKGIGKSITKALSELTPKMYSTVRTKNIAMNKIMDSLGFEKTGTEYKSERGDYCNFLYVKTK